MRALVLAACFVAATARAQPPRSRVLEARESAAPPFAELVRVMAGRLLGARVPELPEASPLAGGVLVVARVDGVSVWDVPAVALNGGRFPAAAVATCPGLCAPALRDAVAAALLEQQQDADGAEARVLLLADAALPFSSTTVILRSMALATRGAPPALGLVARTRDGLGFVPVFAPPPQPIALGASARPLLLEVDVRDDGFAARTAVAFGPPVLAKTPGALETYVGHLKSRDPDKQVVFLSAADATPLGRITGALAVVRAHFPVVVLRRRGPPPVRAGP